MDWIAGVGETWLSTLAWLAGLAAFFGVAARLTPCNPGMYWWRDLRAAGTDFLYWFVVPIFVGVCRAYLLAAGLKLLFGGAGPDTPLGGLPLWLQCVLVLLIQDFQLYWVHRLFHTRLAWKVHAIHHAPTVLDWLAGARFHPINYVASFVLADVVVLLMGFTPEALAALVPFNIIYSSMVHANLNWTFGPLRYLFASPVFHRWHHTTERRSLDKNFASTFPLLDLFFGTYFMPAGELPAEFGEHDFPTRFWGQLAYPFRRRAATAAEPRPAALAWRITTAAAATLVLAGVVGFGVAHGRRSRERDRHEALAVESFNHGDFDRGIEEASEAIALDPHHASAYANRGAAYLQRGDNEQAIADCTHAIELDGRLALAYANRGGARLNLGDNDGAIADSSRAIELDRRLPIAHVNRGGAYLNRGEIDLSIADSTRAIELDPRLPLAYVNRGGAHLSRGDFDQAVADCSQALAFDSTLALAYFTRGGAYFSKGDAGRAIGDWTAALRLKPDMVNAYANRATARLNRGELPACVADYTEALRLDPKLVVAHLNRGTALVRLGDVQGALADFNRAIALEPALAVAYAYRGALAMQLGTPAQAVADCTRAIELDPRLAVAYWTRALAHTRAGDAALADADRKKALEFDPTLGE